MPTFSKNLDERILVAYVLCRRCKDLYENYFNYYRKSLGRSRSLTDNYLIQQFCCQLFD